MGQSAFSGRMLRAITEDVITKHLGQFKVISLNQHDLGEGELSLTN